MAPINKYIKYSSITLVSILSLALIIGWFLPNTYHLERSIGIQAPISRIFDEVNNLKNWEHWSPWKDQDPHALITFEGPEAGVGAKMIWASNNPKVGKGSQEIILSEVHQTISTRLVFEGWDCSNTANWHFEEQPEGITQVRWSHHSQVGKNIFYKYMSMFMEPMLGKDYERGLRQLKAYLETPVSKDL